MDADQNTPAQSQAQPTETPVSTIRKVRHTVGLVKFLEKALWNTDWFVLIKDGSTQPTDVNWLDMPSFYTKVYRMKLDGELVNTWVRFIYNLRDNWADFEISYRDTTVRASARELSSRRLVRAIGATPEEAVPTVQAAPAIIKTEGGHR